MVLTTIAIICTLFSMLICKHIFFVRVETKGLALFKTASLVSVSEILSLTLVHGGSRKWMSLLYWLHIF